MIVDRQDLFWLFPIVVVASAITIAVAFTECRQEEVPTWQP